MSSEVRQLQERIERELAAMRDGLVGLAAGVAKHQFIDAKMRRLGSYQDELASYIGSEASNHFSCKAYIKTMEADIKHDRPGQMAAGDGSNQDIYEQ